MVDQPKIWKKRVLIPFWFLRICIMLFLIGSYAYALRAADGMTRQAIANTVLYMLFVVICLLIDVLAIVLFMRDALKPRTFLNMNCFQTGFFGGALIMDLVAIMRGTSAAGIGFSVFVFLTFVGLLIYSAVGYHRTKKQAQRGSYAAAHNPAMYNPAMPTEYAPQYQDASPYQRNIVPVELQQNQLLPPYQSHGTTADYYTQQPLKPAHMV